ncbi:MAG: hypothetical protein ACXAC5_17170 [Promethearchaeota archaeon]|jgi:hypothetical protein
MFLEEGRDFNYRRFNYGRVESMDGEYVPVTFSTPEQDMKDTEVLIFLDEETRHIYIWTGENSNVRKRFISSQIARQMRLEKGMTHRISTEDQGNETTHFKEFLAKLEGKPTIADTLMEVTPAVAASTTPVKPVPAPSKKSEVKTTKPTKVEKTVPITTAPSPPPKKEEPKETKKIKKLSQVYFANDTQAEVLATKAKILIPAGKTEATLVALHASSAATEGKIALYLVKKKTKITSIKTEQPIFVMYLKPNSASVFELDDLEIPIPAGNSIYYTCPGKTFIGINIE